MILQFIHELYLIQNIVLNCLNVLIEVSHPIHNQDVSNTVCRNKIGDEKEIN